MATCGTRSDDVPTSSNRTPWQFCIPESRCLYSLCILWYFAIGIILAIFPLDHLENSLAVQGDTLYLASASGLLYREYSVQESVQDGDSHHSLQFITVPCQDLQTHNFQGHFQSRELYLTYKTRMLGVVDYLYLLQGSNVSYSICLWTNQTLTTSVATFFVFNSLSAYQDFVSDLTDGDDMSVMQQDLRIGSPEDPACSQINYIAEDNSYYFMSTDCPGAVAYQYNVTMNVKYLNFTDYGTSHICSVIEDQPCKLTINDSFEDICLLGYAIPSPPYNVDLPTTHIKVATLKAYPGIIPVALFWGFLVVLLVMLLFCYCRLKIRKLCARRGYATIQ